VRLQVLLGRSDVDPVVVGPLGEERTALVEHLRERLAFDRDRDAVGDAVEHRRLEHVRARVDPVRRGVVGGRLLDERLHRAPLVGGHDAECRRVIDVREMDRRLGTAVGVEPHQATDVERRQHVPVADDEAVGDPRRRRREADRARGPERDRLDRVPEPNTVELAVGEVLDERVREITE
jgi:hypothetical protein